MTNTTTRTPSEIFAEYDAALALAPSILESNRRVRLAKAAIYDLLKEFDVPSVLHNGKLFTIRLGQVEVQRLVTPADLDRKVGV